jgi:hypothetical protein
MGKQVLKVLKYTGMSVFGVGALFFGAVTAMTFVAIAAEQRNYEHG